MKKEQFEAGKLMMKSLQIMMKLDEMSLEEKRRLKREVESVEVYVKRIEEIQVGALIVSMRMMMEEQKKSK